MRLQQNTKSADYRTQLQQFVNLGILPANTNLCCYFNGNVSANLASVLTYKDQMAASQIEGAFSNERRILNPNGFKIRFQYNTH
jgi:hypothetical protein